MPPQPSASEPPHPSARSQRGLDWFIFFLADIQTGFGPFIAVYLTSQKWTQTDIGLVLSMSGIIALILQMPGGALVDWARRSGWSPAVALRAIAAAALTYALLPVFPMVAAAAAVHAAASCVLGPCVVAMSLGLVGHAAIGERLGRNARFASIGNGVAAAGMGAVGYLLSPRWVFFVTAALLIPALLALGRIRPREVDPELAHGGLVPRHARAHAGADQHDPAQGAAVDSRRLRARVSSRERLDAAADGQRAHHAIERRMGDDIDRRLHRRAATHRRADLALGRAQRADLRPPPVPDRGVRRAALRGTLFALVDDPYLLVAVQVLDGITAASLGIMVPLMVTDITRGTGRLNLAQGIVGTAVGIGASISPTLAGYLSDTFGSSVAFAGLAAIAAVGFAGVWALMPETREAT